MMACGPCSIKPRIWCSSCTGRRRTRCQDQLSTRLVAAYQPRTAMPISNHRRVLHQMPYSATWGSQLIIPVSHPCRLALSSQSRDSQRQMTRFQPRTSFKAAPTPKQATRVKKYGSELRLNLQSQGLAQRNLQRVMTACTVRDTSHPRRLIHQNLLLGSDLRMKCPNQRSSGKHQPALQLHQRSFLSHANPFPSLLLLCPQRWTMPKRSRLQCPLLSWPAPVNPCQEVLQTGCQRSPNLNLASSTAVVAWTVT